VWLLAVPGPAEGGSRVTTQVDEVTTDVEMEGGHEGPAGGAPPQPPDGHQLTEQVRQAEVCLRRDRARTAARGFDD
jgi:hypothetical protein